MSDIVVPHFSFPFRLSGDDFALIEQDSEDEIVQSVRVLVSTPTESRVELPEYGVDDPLFTQDTDLHQIADAVEEWEPRASVSVDESIDSLDKFVRHIGINVSIGDEE